MSVIVLTVRLILVQPDPDLLQLLLKQWSLLSRFCRVEHDLQHQKRQQRCVLADWAEQRSASDASEFSILLGIIPSARRVREEPFLSRG